jgi:hypothetical protein
MALLNVRLDPEDTRRAKALREAGIRISTVVRNAIRAEYDKRLGAAARAKKPSKIVADILTALPSPADSLRPRIDARDRRALRRVVATKLRRQR